MALKDGLLAEYDHEVATTRKLLERLPDDRLSWKPHVKSMSLGGLATHLGNIPTWGAMILNDPFFDLAGSPPNLGSIAEPDFMTEFFQQLLEPGTVTTGFQSH